MGTSVVDVLGNSLASSTLVPQAFPRIRYLFVATSELVSFPSR
jgi:hypothetical protein